MEFCKKVERLNLLHKFVNEIQPFLMAFGAFVVRPAQLSPSRCIHIAQ